MIKILHIISGDLWAGAEAQALTLISRLAQTPGTEVAAVVMNEGELMHKLRGGGISVFVLNEERLNPARLLLDLRGLMMRWHPDVIHTHRAKENILGSIANRVARNVPSVRTIHGGSEHQVKDIWDRIRHGTITRLDRWCGRALQQRIIAVSEELGSRIVKDFPLDKIVVIENGIDAEALRDAVGTAEFRVREPHYTHLGMVGRLVAVKRVDLFLAAAALLRRRLPGRDWRFHLFGDGPLRGDLAELSERLGVADVVTFHGHRKDIATCVAALDAVVMCSDHEGMPMAALEAAILGVPIVAHAVGGLPDIVPEEFLVTRHEPAGYVDGVLRAFDSNGRAIARSRAEQLSIKYSAQANAERIRAVYEQVLAERVRCSTANHSRSAGT